MNGQSLPPRISEFVADNKFSFRDGFKDAPDWIELHNPNARALDSPGHCLSDDRRQPAKWTFPAGTSLPAARLSRGLRVRPQSLRHRCRGLSAREFRLAAAANPSCSPRPAAPPSRYHSPIPAQDEDLAYGRTLDRQLDSSSPRRARATWPTPIRAGCCPRSSATPAVSARHRISAHPDQSGPGRAVVLFAGRQRTVPCLYRPAPGQQLSARVRATVRRDGYRSPRAVTHTYLSRAAVPTAPGMNTDLRQGQLSNPPAAGPPRSAQASLSVPNLPDDYVEREGSVEIFLPGSATPHPGELRHRTLRRSLDRVRQEKLQAGDSAPNTERANSNPRLFRGFDRGMPARKLRHARPQRRQP